MRGCRRLGGAVVASVLLIMPATACGGGGGPAPAPPTPSATLHAPSTEATSANPAVAARDKALAAYRGMWAAYEKAGETANPDDPELATYAADVALQTLTNGLRSVRDRGLVIKGDIVLAPAVTVVEPADRPTSIKITDCADDSKSLLYRKSGELYNDKPGGRRLIVATVKDTGGGVWKVVSFGAHDVGSC
jgi:hypothetical protein